MHPNLVPLIALLAIAQYLVFASLVGRARGRYGVQAPAVTGDERFERHYRVQMNTLELMVAFLPALFLAAAHWSVTAAVVGGAVYLVGRTLYAVGYVRDPRRRGAGFLLSFVPTVVLLIGAAVGLLRGL
jgi:uncharacterized MAPEG superfamily protein